MHNFKNILLVVILLIPLSARVYSNDADFSTAENTTKDKGQVSTFDIYVES